MSDPELKPVIDFLYEMGLLKRSRRTGWWVAGIKDPESIADHSFRTAVVGYLLAKLAGVDAGKTAVMCILHDSQETRTGDIPAVGKPYVSAASNEEVTDHQTAGFPAALRAEMVDLVEEYEKRESTESQLAHDADKLELVLQSREYHVQGGHDTDDWLRNSLAALKTPTARRLAEIACQVTPDHWWRAVVTAPSKEPGEPTRPAS